MEFFYDQNHLLIIFKFDRDVISQSNRAFRNQDTSGILLTSQKIETASSSFRNFQRDRKLQSHNTNGRNISSNYFT